MGTCSSLRSRVSSPTRPLSTHSSRCRSHLSQPCLPETHRRLVIRGCIHHSVFRSAVIACECSALTLSLTISLHSPSGKHVWFFFGFCSRWWKALHLHAQKKKHSSFSGGCCNLRTLVCLFVSLLGCTACTGLSSRAERAWSLSVIWIGFFCSYT